MQAEKIRVLHIITRLIAAGADENTIYTVKGVSPAQFESHLLVGGESEIVEVARSLGIHVIVVASLVRNINPLKDLMALISILRVLKNNRYQIVHTHTAKAGFIGRLAARLAGVPVIVHTLHGLSFHDFMPSLQKKLFILLEKLVGNFTDLLISVGENIKIKSIAVGISKPENYVTIYSGMDLSKFENVKVDIDDLKKNIGINDDELVIGTAARLEPRKGPHFFIDVIHRIKQSFPEAKGIIAGTGDFRKKLEKKVKTLGLENDIIFTGFRNDIAEIMSIFDIVCLTSLWEGIPRVLIQGAKLGKPLIAFDIDGNSEVIKHGENGYLAPAKDINKFAELLSKIIEDEQLRNRMSQESKRAINKRWDQDYMVKEIERHYLNLCKKRFNMKIVSSQI